MQGKGRPLSRRRVCHKQMLRCHVFWACNTASLSARERYILLPQSCTWELIGHCYLARSFVSSPMHEMLASHSFCLHVNWILVLKEEQRVMYPEYTEWLFPRAKNNSVAFLTILSSGQRTLSLSGTRKTYQEVLSTVHTINLAYFTYQRLPICSIPTQIWCFGFRNPHCEIEQKRHYSVVLRVLPLSAPESIILLAIQPRKEFLWAFVPSSEGLWCLAGNANCQVGSPLTLFQEAGTKFNAAQQLWEVCRCGMFRVEEATHVQVGGRYRKYVCFQLSFAGSLKLPEKIKSTKTQHLTLSAHSRCSWNVASALPTFLRPQFTRNSLKEWVSLWWHFLVYFAQTHPTPPLPTLVLALPAGLPLLPHSSPVCFVSYLLAFLSCSLPHLDLIPVSYSLFQLHHIHANIRNCRSWKMTWLLKAPAMQIWWLSLDARNPCRSVYFVGNFRVDWVCPNPTQQHFIVVAELKWLHISSGLPAGWVESNLLVKWEPVDSLVAWLFSVPFCRFCLPVVLVKWRTCSRSCLIHESFFSPYGFTQRQMLLNSVGLENSPLTLPRSNHNKWYTWIISISSLSSKCARRWAGHKLHNDGWPHYL